MNVDSISNSNRAQLLTLLQISNSSFPTGAFSHSYGFETWLKSSEISSPAEAEERCRDWLRYSIATCDAVAACHAHRELMYGDLGELVEVNRQLNALKLSRETREASFKAAAAWLAACRDAFDLSEIGQLERVGLPSGKIHHSIAFGVCCASLDFSETDTIETYIWSSFSNLISVIGRLLPIGQSDIQKIVSAARPLIEDCAKIAQSREVSEMYSQYAGLDVASMRHERLRSRLCMS